MYGSLEMSNISFTGVSVLEPDLELEFETEFESEFIVAVLLYDIIFWLFYISIYF